MSDMFMICFLLQVSAPLVMYALQNFKAGKVARMRKKGQCGPPGQHTPVLSLVWSGEGLRPEKSRGIVREGKEMKGFVPAYEGSLAENCEIGQANECV
eukprot:scaffold5258_cov16-Tisochrysis_lutea.AAC.1